MPIVGIVAKENESNFIKNEIAKNVIHNKFDLININKKSIENIKNVKFDCIVICDDIENFLNKSNYLGNLIYRANYIIVNSDKNKFTLTNIKNVITYGLNNSSTVTISSIKDDKTIIYIQNKIKVEDNRLIDEQEFIININKNNLSKLYTSMAVFIILLIYGEIIKKI